MTAKLRKLGAVYVDTCMRNLESTGQVILCPRCLSFPGCEVEMMMTITRLLMSERR